MNGHLRASLIRAFVTLAVVGLLGLVGTFWASLTLFGTGCDPVLDPTLCTPSELAAWAETARSRPQ